MTTYRLLLSAALTTGLAFVSVPANAQFYKGKSLTLLVNYGAGGNADSAARMFQRHIARHIPGSPNVVVQNMPGGGGYAGDEQAWPEHQPAAGRIDRRLLRPEPARP